MKNVLEAMKATKYPSDVYVGKDTTVADAIEVIEQLQTKLAESEARVGRLEKAALIAIHALSGGEAKAEVRDIYDETKSQSLQHIQAGAIENMLINLGKKNGGVGHYAFQPLTHEQILDYVSQLRQKTNQGQ